MTDRREDLARVLTEAQADVRDMGHVWLFGDRVSGTAALRLIERDRKLLERHRPAEGPGSEANACVGCHASFEEEYWCTVDECEELKAAAEFWLGPEEPTHVD